MTERLPNRARSKDLRRVASVVLVLGAMIAATALSSAGSARAAIGDRLVVGVNGVPYTQRQVEIYIQIKESLRKTSDGTARVIAADNWSDAIGVFAEDMIILQESQRLGSFQAPDQALDQYLGIVRAKVKNGAALRDSLARLGVDDAALGRGLQDILRVAAYRRSKDKQLAQDKAQDGGAMQRGRAKWLEDLVQRSVVRRYEGADQYVVIDPLQGQGQGHGQGHDREPGQAAGSSGGVPAP